MANPKYFLKLFLQYSVQSQSQSQNSLEILSWSSESSALAPIMFLYVLKYPSIVVPHAMLCTGSSIRFGSRKKPISFTEEKSQVRHICIRIGFARHFRMFGWFIGIKLWVNVGRNFCDECLRLKWEHPKIKMWKRLDLNAWSQHRNWSN